MLCTYAQQTSIKSAGHRAGGNHCLHKKGQYTQWCWQNYGQLIFPVLHHKSAGVCASRRGGGGRGEELEMRRIGQLCCTGWYILLKRVKDWPNRCVGLYPLADRPLWGIFGEGVTNKEIGVALGTDYTEQTSLCIVQQWINGMYNKLPTLAVGHTNKIESNVESFSHLVSFVKELHLKTRI